MSGSHGIMLSDSRLAPLLIYRAKVAHPIRVASLVEILVSACLISVPSDKQALNSERDAPKQLVRARAGPTTSWAPAMMLQVLGRFTWPPRFPADCRSAGYEFACP